MEQVIKINVPEGKKAVYDESTQTIKFVDKKPTRSESWEEFCKNQPSIKGEYVIASDGVICEVDTTRNRAKCDVSHLSSEKDAEGILALILLTRLHDEWVDNWKESKNSCGYSIFYNKSTDGIETYNWGTAYFLLTFPTKEMAEEFLECFKDLIEKAKRFI